MNKFNNSVKQNCKTAFVVTVVSIVALILCLSVSVTLSPKKAIADPDALQATLDETSNAYFEALATQEEAQAKVNEAEATIAECEEKIPIVQGKLCTRAKSMYMNRGFSEILDLLTGATSIEDLVNNLQYISIVNSKDAALVQSSKELKARVEGEKASLEANLAVATEQANIAADAYNTAQAALQAAKAQQQQQQQQQEEGGGGGGGYHPSPGPAPYSGDVVSTAYNCIGHWYQWGAAGPEYFDCSGLVSYCYGGGGSHIFTTWTFVNQNSGFHLISAGEAVPGDVVSTSGHCGIYIGGGQMIHAPTEGEQVKIAGVQSGMQYYTRR